MQAWVVVTIALGYLAGLFALAAYVDRRKPRWAAGRLRPHVYALGLAVYCTAWAFYGAVGFAVASGWSFAALSLGPALALALFRPTLLRVVRLAKTNNIASVADFIGARYGKSQRVAAVVALAALVAVIPYIALQLKAIASSLSVTLGPGALGGFDPALPAAAALAAFAILFGTRQVAATENQNGLMVAVAAESLVKLVAFLLVGGYVAYGLYDGFGDLFARAAAAGVAAPLLSPPNLPQWTTLTLMSFAAFVLLPRQFHVAVVENRGEGELDRAAWTFPLYLVALNLFVAPVALAGVLAFGAGGPVAPDSFMVALPLEAGSPSVALAAFLGGLSAASAMVIVESVALGIMVSNDIAMPFMLRGRAGSMTRPLLLVRRSAIAAAIAAAYLVHLAADEATLAGLGLIAMAAIAQIAPAFFGGLAWRRATGRGAMAGIAAGVLAWGWTLLLPALATRAPSLAGLVAAGPWGLAWLRPEAMFGAEFADPLTRGVALSLLANALAFVLVSLTRPATPAERHQAAAFCGGETPLPGAATPAEKLRPWRSRATAEELEQTVARYLGPERTETAFRGFAIARGGALDPKAAADLQTLRFAEHLLASAIGAASSRLVLSVLLTRRDVTTTDALKLLGDASAAMQSNRDVLQSALDHARQGVTAIDANMKLVCWNRQFRELFDLPEEMIHFGVGLDDIFRFNAARGLYGPVNQEEFIADRIQRFVVRLETMRTRLYPSGRVIEIRSARMPDGGVVTTYTDISDTVAAQEALERANENLERRVRERTRELTRLNQELARAKTEADEANISKTRFLAAASHDILQPLNAARLFATSLAERAAPDTDQGRLARNIESSLDGVEEIL